MCPVMLFLQNMRAVFFIGSFDSVAGHLVTLNIIIIAEIYLYN